MEQQNYLLGLVGRKGSGKSTLLRQILQRCERLLIFDTMGEHSWVPNRLKNLDQVDEFLAWASTQQCAAARYIPVWQSESDLQETADLIYEQGNFTFVVEEAPMYMSPGALPASLDRLVRLGRHRKANLVWTAQRMAEVARRLTAATDYFVLFGHREPRDLDAIADRCGSEVADQVAQLPLHGFLAWDVVSCRQLGVEAIYRHVSSGRRSQDEVFCEISFLPSTRKGTA